MGILRYQRAWHTKVEQIARSDPEGQVAKVKAVQTVGQCFSIPKKSGGRCSRRQAFRWVTRYCETEPLGDIKRPGNPRNLKDIVIGVLDNLTRATGGVINQSNLHTRHSASPLPQSDRTSDAAQGI